MTGSLRQRLAGRSAGDLAASAVDRSTTWLRDHQPGRVRSACYAPHSAMYFNPDGSVKACCATGHGIGTVTGPDRRPLRDIWAGAALALQRQRLEDGRFDLGCQECDIAVTGGDRSAVFAADFDRWRHGAPHPWPKLLDLALSNRCNLACVMCNGDLSSTIRVKREGRAPLPAAYDDRFFDELAELLPHADRVQFKGGEPFLAPENWRVWELMADLGVACETYIVTNGTVWNDRVEDLVRSLRPELAVSVDGITAEVLEGIRVGTDRDALWANIDRFQALTAETGRVLTLNFCLLRSNWTEVPGFLAEVDRRGVRCNIIPINQPAEHDLFRLPTGELEAVLASLASIPPLRPNPQTQLDRICRRLEAQIAEPTPIEVSVNLTTPS